MYWKLLAIFCVAALFPDPSHGMYSCRGNRFQKITPGSTYLLDSRGAYWWGSKCYNAYTDVGYQLVVDCTASSGGYLELGNRCSWNRNVFWFYPRNGRYAYGCGRHDNLVLKSDKHYFYSRFNNRYRDNWSKRGIKCNVRAEKTGETTTSTPTTTPSSITTTAAITTTTQTATTAPTTTTTPATTTTATTKCNCGAHNKASRIVNGRETAPNEYPFYAGLVRKGSTHIFCGGSLISDRWVLTASHCMVYPARRMQVVLGAHNMDRSESSRVIHDVELIIKHESYNSRTVKNDIALVKLAKPASFSSKISPVCLPASSYTDGTYDKNAIVMGYGTTSFQGTGTRVLHDVELKVETYTQCKAYGGDYSRLVTQDNICTHTVHKDACQGDSGGPLVFDKSNRLTQIGVVSWGVNCAQQDNPGVYAKVENFMDWIHAKTGNTLCVP